MKENKNSLSRALGRTDIIAIGFGTMVGWSWIMFAASWIDEAGMMGALIAFAAGGAIILSIGVTYSELTASLPLAGGEFVFAYRAMGSKCAWLAGWITSMAYMGVAAWEGIALATAVNYMLPIPSAVPLWEVAGYQVYLSWAAVGMAGAVVITLLNFFGVRPAVMFQVVSVSVIIMVVLFIFFGGISFGSADNIGDLFVSGKGCAYVFLTVPAMLIGFDVIPQSSEEMNIGPRNIGKMVIVCILFSLIWYFLLIIATSLAAPYEVRSSGTVPMADIVSYLFNGEMFSAIVIVGGVFGILTSWNGFFIGATRLLFSMSRAGIIPSVFCRIHKKYKTPYVSVLLVGAVCMTAPLMGMNALVWFMNTSTMCALFSYIFVVISFILLRKNEPELYRPFKVKGGVKFGAAVLTVTIIYFILYLKEKIFSSGVSPELVIVFLWLCLGLILTKLTDRERGAMTGEERELLVFGERFARKGERHER